MSGCWGGPVSSTSTYSHLDRRVTSRWHFWSSKIISTLLSLSLSLTHFLSVDLSIYQSKLTPVKTFCLLSSVQRPFLEREGGHFRFLKLVNVVSSSDSRPFFRAAISAFHCGVYVQIMDRCTSLSPSKGASINDFHSGFFTSFVPGPHFELICIIKSTPLLLLCLHFLAPPPWGRTSYMEAPWLELEMGGQIEERQLWNESKLKTKALAE